MALPVQAKEAKHPVQITGMLYNASTRSVTLIADHGQEYSGEYQSVKLSQPNRMIIDIPHAVLGTTARSLSIQQHGIQSAELSQSLGSFYQVTRVTLQAENADALNAIRLQPKGRLFEIVLGTPGAESSQNASLPPLPSKNQEHSFLDNPIPNNRNVITSAVYDQGLLKLSARPGEKLHIKNQFTLTSPSRLVIDVGNAVLANKNMTTPIDVMAGPIRSIRLGQFDEETVRIVVDTTRPNAIFVTYPGEDRSQLAISANAASSIRTLPIENQTVGYIQDLTLTKKEETNIIRINTSDPMVRRLVRKGNQIEVDLVNIAAQQTDLAFDKQAFPDIKEIRFNPLHADEPNTKVIIKLDNPKVEMESAMSADGKILEIFLTSRPVSRYSTARMPQIISPGDTADNPIITSVKRGSFTVVIDAGHGGKDKGANREGVLEKDLNLSVALKLKYALEAKGVTVHMTRSTDTFLELSQITAITNRIRPDAFVSVHTNASVSPAANGIETYYYTPQSRDLANRVHRRMVNMINAPDRNVRTARFYVIRNTNVPAILCEMGYVSNPEERQALQSDVRQRATAEAIAQGVVEFLGRSIQATAP